ncbi:MAG: YHS domain-containing protein [Rhodospirillales bacterium]|nr:YHS domain-containing protein [Rhodospirillales bacterium]
MTPETSIARRTPAAFLFGVFLFLLAAVGVAAPAQAGMTVFTDDGAAIRGYDPVAYFTDGKPVPGKAEFSHEWMGVTWRFASAEHRDAFAAEPEKFAPQYGGFCAWAVSEGYTAEIDPAAWRIEGDKLYLNYSQSVQSRWAQDIPGNIGKADKNWPDIKAGLAAK